MDRFSFKLASAVFPAAILVLLNFSNVISGEISWADRGDRHEGVINSSDISGGNFELLGVHVGVNEDIDLSTSELKVSFWLPEAQAIKVKVWEPEKNYWMAPQKQDFHAGTQSFAWPVSDVLKPLKMDLSRLQVLVTDRAETIYFPAQLSSTANKKKSGPYRFDFESKGGVELTGTIFRETEKRLVPVKEFKLFEDFSGRVQIGWDGKDEKGILVPTGVMHLQLKGLVFLSQTDKKLTFKMRFMHKGKSGE